MQPNPPEPGRKGLTAVGAALGAAILASACCLLPLTLGVLGFSSLVTAGLLESARPYLLGVTGVLLCVGFYLSYSRNPGKVRDPECEVPGAARFKWMQRSLLWLVSLAALSLAFLPSYADILAEGTNPVAGFTVTGGEQLVLRVEGMTCGGCETTVRAALEAIPGVRDASVSHEQAQASVRIDPRAKIPVERLIRAIEEAGYDAYPEAP